MTRTRLRVVAGIIIGAGVIVLLVLLIARSRTGGELGSKGVESEAFRQVKVSVGLVSDYYEHIGEHAPPRDPTGVMQRREDSYHAPPDPFTVFERLGGGKPGDEDLMRLTTVWREQWVHGRLPRRTVNLRLPRDDMGRLREIPKSDIEVAAAHSSLTAVDLLRVARGIQFLAGDAEALPWYRAGLSAAAKEYRDVPPGDLSVRPFLVELEQTKALWRLWDYPTLEKRFAFAARHYPTLSPEARRAVYLRADALYYEGHNQEAADSVLLAAELNKSAGDLGKLDASDVGEMNWAAGLFLYSANRYGEAAPYFEAYLAHPDNRKAVGAKLYAMCLDRLDRAEEARLIRKRYGLDELDETSAIWSMLEPRSGPGWR